MGRIYQQGNFGFASTRNVLSVTKLLIHSDTTDASTTITDSSSSGHTVAAHGDAQHSTTQQKWGKTALKFDGTGDYLDPSNSNDFDFADGDMTIDFWVYFDDISASRGLFGAYTDDDNFCALYWSVPFAGVVLDFEHAVGDEDETEIWTWTPLVNTWYHFAFTRWGNRGNVFIDGVALSPYKNITDEIDASDNIMVGAAKVSTAGGIMYHQGYLDEFRVVKGMAMWETNFIPPLGPYK